jgi:hypothetical protein
MHIERMSLVNACKVSDIQQVSVVHASQNYVKPCKTSKTICAPGTFAGILHVTIASVVELMDAQGFVDGTQLCVSLQIGDGLPQTRTKHACLRAVFNETMTFQKGLLDKVLKVKLYKETGGELLSQDALCEGELNLDLLALPRDGEQNNLFWHLHKNGKVSGKLIASFSRKELVVPRYARPSNEEPTSLDSFSENPPHIDNPDLAHTEVYRARRYFASARRAAACMSTSEEKLEHRGIMNKEDPQTWKQGLVTGNMILRDEKTGTSFVVPYNLAQLKDERTLRERDQTPQYDLSLERSCATTRETSLESFPNIGNLNMLQNSNKKSQNGTGSFLELDDEHRPRTRWSDGSFCDFDSMSYLFRYPSGTERMNKIGIDQNRVTGSVGQESQSFYHVASQRQVELLEQFRVLKSKLMASPRKVFLVYVYACIHHETLFDLCAHVPPLINASNKMRLIFPGKRLCFFSYGLMKIFCKTLTLWLCTGMDACAGVCVCVHKKARTGDSVLMQIPEPEPKREFLLPNFEDILP